MSAMPNSLLWSQARGGATGAIRDRSLGALSDEERRALEEMRVRAEARAEVDRVKRTHGPSSWEEEQYDRGAQGFSFVTPNGIVKVPEERLGDLTTEEQFRMDVPTVQQRQWEETQKAHPYTGGNTSVADIATMRAVQPALDMTMGFVSQPVKSGLEALGVPVPEAVEIGATGFSENIERQPATTPWEAALYGGASLVGDVGSVLVPSPARFAMGRLGGAAREAATGLRINPLAPTAAERFVEHGVGMVAGVGAFSATETVRRALAGEADLGDVGRALGSGALLPFDAAQEAMRAGESATAAVTAIAAGSEGDVEAVERFMGHLTGAAVPIVLGAVAGGRSRPLGRVGVATERAVPESRAAGESAAARPADAVRTPSVREVVTEQIREPKHAEAIRGDQGQTQAGRGVGQASKEARGEGLRLEGERKGGPVAEGEKPAAPLKPGTVPEKGAGAAAASFGEADVVVPGAPVEGPKPVPPSKSSPLKVHLHEQGRSLETFRVGGRIYYRDVGEEAWRTAKKGGVAVAPLERALTEAGAPPPSVRGAPRVPEKPLKLPKSKVTAKPADVIQTPREALRYAYKQWRKGAKEGWSTGRKLGREEGAVEGERKGLAKGRHIGQLDLTESHEVLIDYAKSHLGTTDYARIAPAIARSRTPGERRYVIRAVNYLVTARHRKNAVREFQGALKEARAEARPEYRKQVEQAIAEVNPKTSLAAVVRRFESLHKHVTGLEVEDIQPGVSHDLMVRMRGVLAESGRKSMKNLGIEEIEGLTTVVKHITHLSKTKDRLLASKRWRDRETAVKAAVQEIHDAGKPQFKKGLERKVIKKMGSLWRWAVAGMESHDTRVFSLSKKRSGAVWDILVGGLKEGRRRDLEGRQRAQKYVEGVTRKLGITGKDIDAWSDHGKRAPTVDVKLSSGRTMRLTLGQWVDLYNSSKDVKTAHEMIRNKGPRIRFKGQAEEGFKLRLEDRHAVQRASVPEKLRKFADALRRYINDAGGPALNKAFYEENGFYLFDSASGEYWPRTRDLREKQYEPDKMLRKWVAAGFDNKSIFKPKKRANLPLEVQNGLDRFMDYVRQSNAYIGKSRVASDAAKLLGDPRFVRVAEERVKHGDALRTTLKDTLTKYHQEEMRPNSEIDPWLTRMIRRMQVAHLALKPQIMAYQTISLGTATTAIEPKYLAAGTKRAKFSGKRIREEMRKYSSVLYGRATGSGHMIITPMEERTSSRQFFTGKDTVWRRNQLRGIHAVDQMVVNVIWEAGKEKARAEGAKGEKVYKRGAEIAEDVVDRTQSTYDLLTIPQLSVDARSSGLLKLATMYSSDRAKCWNIIRQAHIEWAHGPKTQRDTARFMHHTVMASLVPATELYLMQRGFRILTTGVVESGEEELKRFVFGTIKRVFGQWLIVGDAAQMALDVAETAWDEKRPWSEFNSLENPLVSAVKNATDAGEHAVMAVVNYLNGKQTRKYWGSPVWPKDAGRALDKGLRALGVFTGVPVEGVYNVVKAGHKWMTDPHFRKAK